MTVKWVLYFHYSLLLVVAKAVGSLHIFRVFISLYILCLGGMLNTIIEKTTNLVNWIGDVLDCRGFWAGSILISASVLLLLWLDVFVVRNVLLLFDSIRPLREFSKVMITTAISALLAVNSFEVKDGGISLKFSTKYATKEMIFIGVIGVATLINLAAEYITVNFIPNGIVVYPYVGMSVVLGYITIHLMQPDFDISNEKAPILTGLFMGLVLWI